MMIMSANGGDERSFEAVTASCVKYFGAPQGRHPIEIVREVMDDVNFPMHNFAHHYLVPAVLLAAMSVRDGSTAESFEKRLAETAKRAKNVLPAFCGFYGACGAAVGCGIFMSVYTGTTPLSKDTWSLCNYATSGALEKMADLGGPRCCKRNTFTAFKFMKQYMVDNLSAELDLPEEIECGYSKFNAECIKKDCPYYKDEGE